MITQAQFEKKVCRAMGWSYSNGWAFEKTPEGLNITGEMHKTRDLIKQKLCLSCSKPIGDNDWQEITTLKRFGQMLFEHKNCTEV